MIGCGDPPCGALPPLPKPGTANVTTADPLLRQLQSPSSGHRLSAQETAPPPSSSPLPMFAYDGSLSTSDLLFPDYSYWGHELSRLWRKPNSFVMGWDEQRRFLQTLSDSRPWIKRHNMLTWRGRHSGSGRDALRHQVVMCQSRFRNEGRNSSAQMFNFHQPDTPLPALSHYRYNLYLESGAWSTNFKQKLASGSPVFALDPRSPEFFSRALVPGRHYIPFSAADMCNKTVQLMAQMNAHAENESLISDGTSRWSPVQVAEEAAAFLEKHLTMAHVRRYILDTLRVYASLQSFQVQLPTDAVCYDGRRLLEQFSKPHEVDMKLVAAQYPWLHTFSSGACPSQVG